MKRKTRVLTLATAGLMALSMGLLPGCSNGPAESTSGTGSGGDSNLEPVTIKWYVVNSIQNDTEKVVDKVNEMLAERTDLNVTLEYNVLDWSSYDERINLMLQSNQQVDLCYSASWINVYQTKISQGAFLALDDLLDKYGTDIKSQVADKYWDGVSVGGKIYGVPNYQGYAQPAGFTFRKDLVDKYNFDYKSVKSLQDLEPFLEQIKQNESGVIPFLPSGTSALDAYSADASAQYYDGLSNNVCYDTRTGEMMWRFDVPFVQENLKTVHDWYEKGYIRSDAATRVSQFSDECRSGQYAVMELAAYYNDGTKSTQDYGYETYDVATTPPMMLTTGKVQTGQTVIPKTSANPERAMMLLNAIWADKEIYNTLGFGLEGEHWNWLDKENETIELVPDSNYSSPIMYELGSAFNKYYTTNEPKEFMEAQEANNEAATVSPLLGFSYDATQKRTENAQLEAIYGEQAPLLYTGTVDPEAELANIRTRMVNAGLDEVMKDMQAQIDAWKDAVG